MSLKGMCHFKFLMADEIHSLRCVLRDKKSGMSHQMLYDNSTHATQCLFVSVMTLVTLLSVPTILISALLALIVNRFVTLIREY